MAKYTSRLSVDKSKDAAYRSGMVKMTHPVRACRARHCSKPARVKGLCWMHDKRQRRAKEGKKSA